MKQLDLTLLGCIADLDQLTSQNILTTDDQRHIGDVIEHFSKNYPSHFAVYVQEYRAKHVNHNQAEISEWDATVVHISQNLDNYYGRIAEQYAGVYQA